MSIYKMKRSFRFRIFHLCSSFIFGVLSIHYLLSYYWDERFLAQQSLTLTQYLKNDRQKIVSVFNWISLNINHGGEPLSNNFLRPTAREVFEAKRGWCGDSIHSTHLC